MTVKQIKSKAVESLSGERVKSAFFLILCVLAVQLVNYVISGLSLQTRVYDIVTACVAVLFAFPFFATVMKWFLVISRGGEKKLSKILSPFKRSYMTLVYFSFMIYLIVYVINLSSIVSFENSLINTGISVIKLIVYIYLSVWAVTGAFVIADSSDVNFPSFLKYTKWYVKKTFFKTVKVTLSFAGWLVLSFLTMGIALLWVVPYFVVCLAKVYDNADSQLCTTTVYEELATNLFSEEKDEDVTEDLSAVQTVVAEQEEKQITPADETVIFTREMLEEIKKSGKNE